MASAITAQEGNTSDHQMQSLGDNAAPENLAQTWLSLQCRMIAGVTQGVLVLDTNNDGSFRHTTHWPKGSIPTPELLSVIQSAIKQKNVVCQDIDAQKSASKQHCDLIASPLLINNQLIGVVGIEIHKQLEAKKQTVIQMLKWGTTWLEIMLHQQGGSNNALLASAIEFLTTCLEYDNVQIAATALTTELASRMGFERVSFGFVRNNHTQIFALSNNVRFDAKSNLVNDIGRAMDEALDQQSIMLYPPTARIQSHVFTAHEKLSRQCNNNNLCTIPLKYLGKYFGALTFERPEKQPIDEMTLGLCIQIASLVGPVLGLKIQQDASVIKKTWQGFIIQLSKLFGPRHPFFKLVMSVCTTIILLLAFITGEHKITATATLEGKIQRTVVMPADGYIASASFRAGDIVKKDTVLATLDDRELRLEQVKWSSKRNQFKREQHKALAEHDRTQVNILSIQIAQADAQLALINEQLSRTQLHAPLDGIIVNGDLSQSLGAPVERGQVLFTVAPLDSYRIVLKVDESEINSIMVNQTGHLVLSSMPDKVITFKVSKITPVSEVEEGQNFFMVEAETENKLESLRPGMTGVGKIETGQEKLIWIWTHRFFEWFNMKLWAWWF
ncbi:MAG: efflux RND transporter periplasmic adaptor subunit [Gammaproteobacteria bacterium]|nr:efflux RND transporter periplasmic adaptor subunit [Gammaproteobacteria bacterium]MDH5593168.1 efflux RND transporter periplasmic adaptor subunit [Gammaproteobacteria bacterium]